MAVASADHRIFLDPLCDWASQLESSGLATLLTYRGSYGTVLRVYMPGDMSLATVNCAATSSMQLFKSVFDRRAPVAKTRIEQIIGMPIGQGTAIRVLSDGLLEALTAAYKEAASGKLAT